MRSGIIRLENVTAGYLVTPPGFRSIFRSRYIVLRNVNLEISAGERVAIIGRSGSGKTTLLKVILGLLKPFSGRVLVYGEDIYKLPWKRRVRVLKRMGYVPQDPSKSLNPLLKVKTTLKEPFEANSVSDDVEEKIRSVVKLVGLPESVLEMYPEELSGGMKQRVLIARALISEPSVLILDEPTSALDVSVQAQILNLINKIYEKLKLTIITVTHDLAVAQYIADKIAVIENGEIVEEGSLNEILSNPKSSLMRSVVLGYLKRSSE